MGAITAKALNSTLGTANFKGFDELMYEVLDRIHDESRHFAYSSTELYASPPADLATSFSTAAGEEKEIISFTLPYDGVIGLSYKLSLSSASTSHHVHCKIYKNGVQVISVSTNDSSSDEEMRMAKLDGVKGDVFKIKLSYVKDSSSTVVAGSGLNLILYGIYATMVEGKLMTWQKLA